MRLRQKQTYTPEVWLGMQMTYDLAQLEKQADKIKVRRVA